MLAQEIYQLRLYLTGAGFWCQIIDIVIVIFSVCSLIVWSKYKRLQIRWDIKKELLMRWPRLLIGTGILAAIIGVASCIFEWIGCLFGIDGPYVLWVPLSRQAIVGDSVIALVSLLHGGVAFLATLIQYSIYKAIVTRWTVRKGC